MRTERIYRATAHYAGHTPDGYDVVKHYRSHSSARAWKAKRLAGYPAQTLATDGIDRPGIKPADSVSIEVSSPIHWQGEPLEVVHAGPGHYVVAKGGDVVEVHSDRLTARTQKPVGYWRYTRNGRIIGVGSTLRRALNHLQASL